MCFVWISEQTAIVSLYRINWLVCVTGTDIVFTARYGLNLEFRLIVGCNLLTMFSSRIAVGYDIVVGHLNTPVKT